MKLESNGILIGLRPFGERDAVALIFTREYGVLSGMMRGAAVARKNKPLIGQIGNASWNARLDSQLGVFYWESIKNIAAHLMFNPKKLGYMNSIFSLTLTLLPEREKYPDLYDNTITTLELLVSENDDITQRYLKWESNLLRDLGYALDTTKCSGCGDVKNLEYLSPRTGRAVCNKCAEPYLDKLFKLPLRLEITQKFLEKICEHYGVSLPIERKILGI